MRNRISCMPNSISEWFGHRIYPTVQSAAAAIEDQHAERCPFLSAAFSSERKCIKAANSRGVCTVSSEAEGKQMDWVVCPYRTLASPILEDAARRLFRLKSDQPMILVPAPALAEAATQERVRLAIHHQRPTLVYFMDKLGGEIDLPGSRKSPKFKLDTTLVEMVPSEDGVGIGKHGILEVQTMDYHGSYAAATASLTNALKLHPKEFAEQLKRNPNWAANGIQSPNIANVFKRTICQLLFKFQLGHHQACAGCILAIPQSVWLSWQPHLGAPELIKLPDGSWRFDQAAAEPTSKGWILVFEVRGCSQKTPNPISITKAITTDSHTLAQLAFEKAPSEAMNLLASGDVLRAVIRRRISEFWPDLWPRMYKKAKRKSG
jgi:hypothetical protein